METEDQLSARYEAELAAIAAVDCRYYRNPCPSLAERRAYALRQVQLEEVRSRFYAEIVMCREGTLRPFRRCRSFMRRTRRSFLRY